MRRPVPSQVLSNQVRKSALRNKAQCGFLSEAHPVGEAKRVCCWPARELECPQAITFERRAEFELEILEELSIMNCDDDLPLMLLRQRAQERSEMCDVDVVHRLNRIVEDEPRELAAYRQMQRDEQRESGSVEIASAEHRARRTASAAMAMDRDQLRL